MIPLTASQFTKLSGNRPINGARAEPAPALFLSICGKILYAPPI